MEEEVDELEHVADGVGGSSCAAATAEQFETLSGMRVMAKLRKEVYCSVGPFN